ncbi:MAG TPA: GAF domain-containing protein [Herpetosiphonaceae bacterium]
MRTKTSSAQACFTAIAALARWLPDAPREPVPLVSALAELLAIELPMLDLSIALQQHDGWLLHGTASPEAHAWLASLATSSPAPGAGRRARRANGQQPHHSVLIEPLPDLRMAIAVWSASLPAAAFDALVAQIGLALTTQAQQPSHTPETPVLHERPAELAALQHIAHELNATLDLNRVLEAVLREAVTVTNATHGSIALRQTDDQFHYVVTSGFSADEAEYLASATTGSDDPSSSEALRLGQAVIVPVASPNAAPNGHAAFASTLDVPIRYGDRVVGLIILRSTIPGTFSSAQLPFMQLIADQTAVAIGNAQHVAEQQRQRELLQQRANVLSEVLEVGNLLRADRPLTDILTDIAYGIINAVGFRSVIINMRSDADPSYFERVAFAGILPDEAERLRLRPIPEAVIDGLCDERWQISRSYFIADQDVADTFGDALEQFTTKPIVDPRTINEWQRDDMFITPLRSPTGTMIGFISVDDPFDRRRPTRRRAEALEIFANQAMIAIENARLYNNSQRRLAEQDALNRIHQVISASLDIHQILREVYTELRAVLKMDSYYSVVYHTDSTTSALEISVDEGEWEERNIKMDQQAGLHAYMMRQQQSLLFGNLYPDAEWLPDEYRPTPFGNTARASASWMGTPLVASDQEVIGALSVHSYVPNQFGPDELQFLQAVAHQVAISLQNARLFAERERRLHEVNVLNQLAQALAAPISLDELAEVLFSQIQEAFNINTIFLAVYNRESDLIEFPLYVERGGRSKLEPRRGENGITEYILRTREPLLLNDDITAQLAMRGINVIGEMSRSFVAVPMLIGEETVGVISVQDFERNHAFGQYELNLLQTIALQVASGIEKARLLHEREHQIAQMQALNNIGTVTSSTLDLDEIFMGMYIELSRYRHTDALMLLVTDPEAYTVNRIIAVDRGQLLLLDSPQPIQPESYTDVIMRSGKPILLRNAPEEQTLYGIKPNLVGSQDQVISWVGVPLLNTSGQPFGVLSMQGYTVGAYDLRDIDFLTNVANQIALNIQNASLFKQTREQLKLLAAETERLEQINRVSSWASGMLDVNELLQRTVNEMAHVTNADQARLLLFDRPRGIGICQAELYDTGAVGRLTVPLINNPAVAWIDERHTSMLVHNAVEDPRFAPIHEVLRSENIRDILVVPLIVKDEVIGSVGLDAQAREHSFSDRDIATCETIANQVATAIENARLWKATQQSVHELTLLYDLSVSLTTMLDLDEILATLANAALEIERADLSAVVLFDKQGAISGFAGLTQAGGDLEQRPFEHNSILQQVMQNPRPLVVNDCWEESGTRCLDVDDGLRSYIVVPVMIKSQPVGTLVIAARQARTWSDREQSLLTILTGQAASAIENAHLFKSEQEKRQLADTLREVALSLSSTLDLKEVLEIILGQLLRVVHYDSTSVQLLIEEGAQLEMLSQRSTDDSLDIISPDQRFSAHRQEFPNYLVVETQQPYIVNDTHIEYPAFTRLPHTQHIRSWMGIPLLYGSQLLGMITLDSRQPNFYTRAMADVAMMFATQAAQAIAHARLFEQIRRFNVELEQMVAERTAALTEEKERLEAVHTITTTLTASLDIDEIVLKTLELAANAVGVRRGSVLIRDSMNDLLLYRAVLTEKEGLISTAEPFNLPPGNLVQWTLEHQQGVCIADVRHDSRWVDIGDHTSEIRSFLAVPLLAADVPLGVLMLNSNQPGYFGEEHFRLLSTIASEVAIAVHNAELYNFINEQATRLAELLQIQREETGKNRAILESIAEGVLVLDEQNTVVLYNRAATEVLQIPDEIIIGHSLDRIAKYGGDSEKRQRALLLYDALAEGVSGAQRIHGPLHTQIEMRGQTIDATFTPVTTPDGQRIGVAAVLRDITREIEADKAKREFISTVSHELRTPLTSVKGYVDLLMLGTAGQINDLQKNFLQVVKSNADRLNALVEDLLEISRLENGKVTLNIKMVKIADLINDITASLRTETERKGMQVTIEIQPTLPAIEADNKRISQVLTNLISNAHKYTREGGQITVRAFQIGDVIQVDVADTGVGIPSEELPKMFSRFFRANNSLKDEVGGTGLGLSIAKSFVELHGGDMWVTSQIDVGSTFSFSLPIEHRRPPRDEDTTPMSEVVHAS